MSELRWDPLDRVWSLIATERGRRPTDFLPPPRKPVDRQRHPCPFCLIIAGHGPSTRIHERKVVVDRRVVDRVLVVANRFPALSIESPTERRQVGPYDSISGVGAHEVVLETGQHDLPFRRFSAEQIAAVLLTWRDRVADLMRDRRVQHVQVFQNDGPRAGATLEHAHSQIVATPVRPPRLVRQLEAARSHWLEKERCLLCDILAYETADTSRRVAEDPSFFAFCPYASRHPFEVHIAPRRHSAHFTALSEDDALGLGRVMQKVMTALGAALRDADMNICLTLAPSTQSFTRDRLGLEQLDLFWHWRLEVLPRVVSYGGYELGSEIVINPTSPEDAALHLRTLLD